MKRRATIILLASLLSACVANPRYQPGQVAFHELTQGRFEIELGPAKFAQTGGKGNPAFDALVRSELDRRGLCKGGYQVADPIVLERHVAVVGRCV